MFPSLDITGGQLDGQLLYLALLGILLFIGTIIRLNVPILRKYHIPAALVGGLIGLLLGPSVLGIIPAEVTANWSNLTGRLIVVVFAPMFMGMKGFFKKGDGKLILGTVCGYQILGAMQFAVPLLLGALLLEPAFGVSKYFGCIVEEGWFGGHGTAGGMGAVFEPLGFMDGQTLATTSATFGLIFGVVAGVVLINIAVRKGYTKFIKEESKLTIDSESEIYLENAPVESHKTISNNVVNSTAFHATIISIAVFAGYFMNALVYKYLKLYLSWFVCALLAGVFMNYIINKTKYASMVDPGALSSISGVALEFLVTGAMASLNLSVLVANFVPLMILMVTMAVLMVAYVFYYCRRTQQEDWFENAIFLFGQGTGVAATGYLLLRTCDPQYKSNVMKRMALMTPFGGFFFGGGIFTTLVPDFVSKWGSLNVGLAWLAYGVLWLIIPRIFKIWGAAKPYTD